MTHAFSTTPLPAALAALSEQHGFWAILRALLVQRLNLRQSRPPPQMRDLHRLLGAHLLRDIGLQDPPDPA